MATKKSDGRKNIMRRVPSVSSPAELISNDPEFIKNEVAFSTENRRILGFQKGIIGSINESRRIDKHIKEVEANKAEAFFSNMLDTGIALPDGRVNPEARKQLDALLSQDAEVKNRKRNSMRKWAEATELQINKGK